ncbi:MAG: HAMP domain-containing sensor histidine kinase [Saprospiraceae bacterium]|nr:HAMP domain-containing sensor histidine kinase [Saprospiraceae bacterium]
MKAVKVPYLVTIAAIGWLIMLWFQAKWITESRNLIEEQFDQKVSLALCAAVGSLDSSTVVACSAPSGGVDMTASNLGLLPSPGTGTQELPPDLHRKVGEALRFYDIDLAYEISVGQPAMPTCDPASPYCCVLNPFQTSESALLNIHFPGKGAYLFKEIGWMVGASILILLFLLAIFGLALRALIRQKRISQWNIDFFNNMAHEFKTPLTNIRLAMQRLVSRHPELRQDPFVEVVRKEDDKLGQQIEGVLNMASMENGGVYLNRQRLDVQGVLREVIDDMRLQIQETGARVTLHPTTEPLLVEGDRFHLSQAFRNLIDNALKYTDTTPEIDIRLARQGNQAVVVFDDNGVGIARKDRGLVFNKFHRVPNGNRHDQKGFGLGLSYVKMIVNDHRGSVRVLNKNQKGSQFELMLPAV